MREGNHVAMQRSNEDGSVTPLTIAYAVRAFLDPHRIVAQDRRRDYCEDRYRMLGAIDGRTYVVVYTMRGSAFRIISARKVNAKEAADYEHNTRQD